MTEYTIDVNSKRYELSEQFRTAIEERAELEYERNGYFSCWWDIASKDAYTESEWEDNIHEEGDPILVIETRGKMVPWERLDQLEAGMMPEEYHDGEYIDEGGGMKTIPPSERDFDKIFGRTHFEMTPHGFDDVPSPGGDDPDKIPIEPERIEGEELVTWIPRHPDIEHTWSAGRAITSMDTWVEWNVQQRANQPRPVSGKADSHDNFESLCRVYDCEQVGEVAPKQDVPDTKSGSVQRKGEDAFENGRFGGSNWTV